MRLPFILFIFIFLLVYPSFSQNKDSSFGEITEAEKNLTIYEKDSSAPAVVLYEKGETFFIKKKGRTYLIKNYHKKIKILDKNGFKYGNITIPILVTKDAHEDIADIEAITHNGDTKSHLSTDEIYPSNTESGILELKFTFPNIEIGSILEYKYTFLSPFYYNLDSWLFQDEIPKVYNEYKVSIPLNFMYNKLLIGEQELSKKEVEDVNGCFPMPIPNLYFSCDAYTYVMEDIPAFKMDQEFMLGPSNYISRLDFELAQENTSTGSIYYTKSWKDIDKRFKKDKDIGKQLRYKGFFGRKIPDRLMENENTMEKAIDIYNFIRDHYTWNEGYGIYGEAKVKEAFNTYVGNVAEINMSLINLLNASGIKTNLMLSSTRQDGLPKKVNPVMSDFNYIIAKARINGKDYLLDATDKHIPFGMLPFHALNHYGRVMDFSDESYWHNIKAYAKNRYQVRARVEFDMESEIAFGSMDVLSLGYNAIELRNLKDEKNEEEYLNALSTHFQNNLEVISYKQVQERSDEKKVSERIQFNIEILTSGDRIYFNPFLIQFFKQNPFLKKERDYPIDFGYPRHYKYQINVSIPEGYEILDLPKKDVIRLGDNMASLKYFNSQNEKAIMISFDFSVNSTYFEPTDYEVLRKLFSRIVEIQNNTLLVLKKVKS